MVIRGLWKRRHRGSQGVIERQGPSPEEERILLRALQDLAGAARGVIYDVSRADRPLRLPLSPVYLEGSASWRRFLRTRRALDDGHLTLLLSLRQLPEDERRLVVDWGTAHANTFLLVEPSEPGCDLTDARSPTALELRDLSRQAARVEPDEGGQHEPWTARTPLGERLRELYGRWIWWDEPLPHGRSQEELLRLTGPSDTLSVHLLPLLYERFPQQSFDVALAELQAIRARAVRRRGRDCPLRLPHPPRAARPPRRPRSRSRRPPAREPGQDVRHDRWRRRPSSSAPATPSPDDMPDEAFERLQMV